MFSVQQLLEGLFNTHTFNQGELAGAVEPHNAYDLNINNARKLIATDDGDYFISGSDDGKLHLFETDTVGYNSAVGVFDGNMHAAMNSSIRALCALGNGVFVSGDDKALLTTWDAVSREPRATIELYNNEVSSITALSADSFLVGTRTGRLGSFGHSDGRALQEASVQSNAHSQEVTALVSYGDVVISGSLDRTAKIWNKQSLRAVHTLQHGSGVLAVDANIHVIVTGSTDGEVRLYRNTRSDDYPLETIMRGLHGSSAVRSVKLLPDNIVMSTGADGNVVFTDILYQHLVKRISVGSEIYAAEILRDGRVAVCGLEKNSCLVFDAPHELEQVIHQYVKKVFDVEDDFESTIAVDGMSEFSSIVGDIPEIAAEKPVQGELQEAKPFEKKIRETVVGNSSFISTK